MSRLRFEIFRLFDKLSKEFVVCHASLKTAILFYEPMNDDLKLGCLLEEGIYLLDGILESGGG
jgi:hypothetical protein